MAAMCVNDIKEIPGYKVILNAVLKAQILQLVDQLAVETNEESVLITANVSDGTLGHLGSNFGNIFLNTYSDVKQQFLGFCLHEYQNSLNNCRIPEEEIPPSSPEKKTAGGGKSPKSPKSPKGTRKRKKAALFTRKPKKTAYQTQPPELETLKSLNGDTLESINQQIEDCPAGQLNTEVENLNNNCTDFTPEISNVSGNVKTFDTENEKSVTEDVSKSGETDKCVNADIKEMPKDIETNVSIETNASKESSELLDESLKCDVVQDSSKVMATDIKSKSPRKKSVKTVNKKGRKGKKGTRKKKDNGSDTDTTIEWSEDPNSPRIPKLEENPTRMVKREPEDVTSEPPDIVSNSQNNIAEQDGTQTKHVIVTKHTTYDSAEEDDNDNVTEQSEKTKMSLQTPANESSAMDTKEEGEMCSKGDSATDTPIKDKSTGGKANNKKGKVVKKKGKRGRKRGFKVAAKVVKEVEEETKSESVGVLEVCNQTMDQITDSVARAISEERKEKLASLDIQTAGLDSIKVRESSAGIENLKNDSMPLLENLSESKDEPSNSDKTENELDNDEKDDELKEKSIKVLAIWNEIVNDTKEASNEVLCDLISDRINQNLDRKSVEKDCQTESQSDNVNVNSAIEFKSVPIEKFKSSSVDSTEAQAREHLKSSECSVSQVKDLATSTASVSNSNSRQGSCEKQTVGNQTDTKSGNDTSDVNKTAKKGTESQGTAPVVIDVDANAKSNTGTTQSNSNTMRASNTPVKQIGTKSGQSTPKQMKTPTQSVNKQKSQSFTPGKQGKGKSLVDNLISTGVPIIIPDDDDDDYHDVEEGQDEFIPNPRSVAFEKKSKQYRDQQEMRAAMRVGQTAQRQGYSGYAQQASSQRPPNSASSYNQYPAHLQQQKQQYQYQGYQETQQFRNQQQYQQQYQYEEYIDEQQYEGQHQMYPPQQSSPAARQQLFTPPKSSTYQRGRPQKTPPYQGREMSPQSHNFSPPTTPTTPKGSGYFKQGYITPTKHPQNVPSQSPQSRSTPNQSPALKQALQHNQYPSVPKPNRPIMIAEEPPRRERKGQASAVHSQYQQSVQREAYIVKPPVSNPQQFQPGQAHEVSTNYEEFLRLQQQQQKQKQQQEKQQQILQQQQQQKQQQLILQQQQQEKQQQIIQQKQQQLLHQQQQQKQLQVKQALQQQLQYVPGAENRPQLKAGPAGMPEMSNVSSMHLSNREQLIGSQIQQAQYQQIPASTDVDRSIIRQSNERTPIKRMRSDETGVSPGMTAPAEPINKRRHTSSDSNSSMSQTLNTKPPVIPQETAQGHPEGQISPSKIPPKLEIDVDDVHGSLPDLPELSSQQGSIKSPSISSQASEVSASDREDKPSGIPLAPQLSRSDLKSFSPPVSPSTRRLHATSGMPAQSSGDDSSVTSQEAASTQQLKKFGCGDCGKSYTTKAALNQHFRKHTQERPFECDVCGKHYSQKGYLKKHILTHFEGK